MTSFMVQVADMAPDGHGGIMEVNPRTVRFTSPGPLGTCSAEGLKFPDAEQDRARTLARMNARTGGMFGTGADLFILTRQQLRKGIRVWRSASPVRAVSSWQAQAFPLFNRLKRNPGAFSPVSSPELLKVGKSHADPGNSPAAYFAGTSRGYRNRVRSSSPRWRGTRNHARSKVGLRPNPPRRGGFVGQARLRPVAVKSVALVKCQTTADVLGGMNPERYALAHMEAVRAAQGKPRALAHVFAAFMRRVRRLAAVSLRTLRELLAQLRRLRAERDTYAGYVQHINAAAYVLLLADLSERLPASEQLPRPPDLLPCPPSAPLAPPA